MLRLRNQISNTLRTAKSTEEILLYLGRNGYGITSLRALPLEQLYALTKDHESLWKSWDELVAMLQPYRQAACTAAAIPCISSPGWATMPARFSI